VYVLEGGMKHWIKTAQDFKDLGYDWNAVSVIPASQTYADGDAKTNVRGQVTSQFVHTLAKGSRGDEVSALQQKLKDLGFFPADVAASGMFGPLTQKAVLAFQKAHGLDQIGAVGPKTRALLNQ